MSWAYALAICLAAAIAEGALSGKNALQELKALKQPRWSLPIAAWMAIGVLYYAVMVNALRALFAADLSPSSVQAAIVLALLILSVNAGSNWLLFRRRDLRAYYLIMFPYGAAVFALIALLARIDFFAALGVSLYGAYLVYAFAWTQAIWRMNAASSK